MELTLIITVGVLLGCFLGLSWFAGSDAPFVPTKQEKIKKALNLVGLKRGQIFFELGSGDGRVVLEAAKMGAHAFGIEQSWIRIVWSKWQAKKQNLKNAQFFHGNIFNKNYQDGDIIYIYLLQKAVDKLEKKLTKELKKGSVVITQTYHFKNWKPYKKLADFWLYRSIG